MVRKNKLILFGFALVFVIIVTVIYVPNLFRKSEKKIIVYAYPDAITGIDPSIEFDIGVVVLGVVYEPLLYYNPLTDKYTPALAVSWEHNENRTIWTFHLRKGVKFHDGSAFNAEAVKVSVERAKAFAEEGGPGFIWQPVKKVEVVDEYTVRFYLSYPAPLDLIASSAYGAYIFSPNVIKESGASNYTDKKLFNWFNSGHEVGTGAYRLVKYDPKTEVVYEKFNDWWGWKIVKNDKVSDVVIMKIVEDEAAQLQGLESKSIDIASWVPRTEIDRLKEKGFNVVLMRTYHNYVLQLNTRRYPMNITEFRRALAYLVPWDILVEKALYGYGRIASGIIPYGFLGHFENLTYTYNFEKAREIIKGLGLLDSGLKLQFVISSGYDNERNFAEILKGELAKLGIDLEIIEAPWENVVEYGQTVWDNPEKAPHLIINDYWPSYPTPYDYLYNLLGTEAEFNWAGYSNTRYDSLLEEAFRLEGIDYNKSMYLYYLAQKIVYDDVPSIGLWDEIQPFVYNNRIRFREDALNPLYMYVIFFYNVEVIKT